MNAVTRTRLIDRLRGHLPDILYTNVPIPAFMETPITFEYLFKPLGSNKTSSKEKIKASPGANTIEGRITAGKNTKYSINEKDLEIDNGTWIVGSLEFGITARAKGRMQGNKFYVSQLILLKK
jgi:hypothetical protein